MEEKHGSNISLPGENWIRTYGLQWYMTYVTRGRAIQIWRMEVVKRDR